MSLFNSYDRTNFLGELNTPLESQGQGVFSPAVQKAKVLANLGLVSDGLGGLLSASPTSGIGYSAGAGGAVTQLTSRTTGVTLNKITGAITLFAAAPSTTPTSFTVTNSTVLAGDTVIASVKSANAANTYVVSVTAVAAGSFQISAYAQAGTTSDSPVINYAIIRAVAA